MLKVLALDRADGWAFVEEGAQIVLVRPPYRRDEAREVTRAIVARAVTQHGYAACDRTFNGWGAVIAFLRSEVAEQAKRDGRRLEDLEAGRSLLQHAPASIVERFLERIETELLPRGELALAEEILAAISTESPRMRDTPEILQRTGKLLADVKKKQKETLQKLSQDDDAFSSLKRRNKLGDARHLAQRCRHGGSLFTPA